MDMSETHEGAEPTKAKRVSNAALQSQVEGLKDEVATAVGALNEAVALMQNVAGVVQAQSEQLEEFEAELKKVGKKAKKAKVGERPGDVLIRNIRPQMVVLKMGNKRDPYRVELQPRNFRGDVQPIPASLLEDRNYLANRGLIFEEITPQEAAAIQYGAGPRTAVHQIDATIERMEDQVVARHELEPNRQGQLPKRPVGLQFPGPDEFPGADAESAISATGAKYGDDGVREFLAFKAWQAQQQATAPGAYAVDSPAPPAASVNLLDRIQQAANSGDQDAIASARYLSKLTQPEVRDGQVVAPPVIPEGALNMPIRVTQHDNVQPVIPG